MKTRRLTPEQVRTAGQIIARIRERLRPILDLLRETARRLGEALRRAVRLSKRVQTATGRDRPAWQSPYGPAPRRR